MARKQLTVDELLRQLKSHSTEDQVRFFDLVVADAELCNNARVMWTPAVRTAERAMELAEEALENSKFWEAEAKNARVQYRARNEEVKRLIQAGLSDAQIAAKIRQNPRWEKKRNGQPFTREDVKSIRQGLHKPKKGQAR